MVYHSVREFPQISLLDKLCKDPSPHMWMGIKNYIIRHIRHRDNLVKQLELISIQRNEADQKMANYTNLIQFLENTIASNGTGSRFFALIF